MAFGGIFKTGAALKGLRKLGRIRKPNMFQKPLVKAANKIRGVRTEIQRNLKLKDRLKHRKNLRRVGVGLASSAAFVGGKKVYKKIRGGKTVTFRSA